MLPGPTKRLSNIEALRLLALVLIIGVHVSTGGLVYSVGGSPSWMVATLLNTYSRFGVDLFVLIGSYFMCTKFLSLKAIAVRWAQIFYPVLVLSLLLFAFSPPASLDEVGSYGADIAGGAGEVAWHGVWLGQLWFIFPFVLLITLSPILNHAIRSMSKREHGVAIVILTAIFIAIPTLNAIATTKVVFGTNDTSTSLVYFVTLYFVAAYIRNYDVRINPLKGVAGAVMLGLLAFGLICLYSIFIPHPSSYPSGAYDYLQGNNTLLIYTGSILLFLAFRSLSFHSSGVSFLGKLTYEAFLFHTVVLYVLAAYWPSLMSTTLPAARYLGGMGFAILVATLGGLGYGLVRYYMDNALSSMFKRFKARGGSQP